jgi:hypothetical protein
MKTIRNNVSLSALAASLFNKQARQRVNSVWTNLKILAVSRTVWVNG